MHCQACGTDVPGGAAFCPGCGKKLDPMGAVGESTENAPASKLQSKAVELRHAADVPEQEQWRGGYSIKAMYGPMAICGVVTLVALIVMLIVPTAWVRYAIAAALVLMWAWIAIQVLGRQWGIRYRLTNQRFFVERGLLRRVTDRIEVIDINDMKYEQTLFERMFDVGSITISSTDHSLPQVTLEGIEHVQEVANLIDQARRAERNRRGLYIETS
jgi:membrane protein YdbS with pleckstrin-like domain